MVNIKPEDMVEERMEVNILDYRLKVMTIDKASIGKFTHPLFDVIFLKHYQENNNRDRHGFVSITETDLDYSVIIEEDALKSFDTTCKELKVNNEVWLPLVVTAGPMLTQHTTSGITKIATTVVIPLADQGISVYLLSTYRTDYILIAPAAGLLSFPTLIENTGLPCQLQEKDFNYACEVLAEKFRITRECTLDSLEIIVDPGKIRKSAPVGIHQLRPLTHSFNCSNPATYCITSMDSEKLRSQTLTITDLIFYSGKSAASSECHSCFFNFSMIDQDISFVMNVNLLDRFPHNLLFNNAEYWHLIRIGDMPEGVGFREAGIVAQISEPIASAQISEYYISSYYYGHTLVPVEHFSEVKNILMNKSDKKAACAHFSQSA